MFAHDIDDGHDVADVHGAVAVDVGGSLFVRQRPRIAVHGGVQVLERARCGGVGHAVDGHRAAGTATSAFADDCNAVAVALRGGDAGHARCDGDFAALATMRVIAPTTSDASGSAATDCRDSATVDGNGAAGAT